MHRAVFAPTEVAAFNITCCIKTIRLPAQLWYKCLSSLLSPVDSAPTVGPRRMAWMTT